MVICKSLEGRQVRDRREQACSQTLKVSAVHLTFLSVNLTASLNGRSLTEVSNLVTNVETFLGTIERKDKKGEDRRVNY
jgi:hypothetical protein